MTYLHILRQVYHSLLFRNHQILITLRRGYIMDLYVFTSLAVILLTLASGQGHSLSSKVFIDVIHNFTHADSDWQRTIQNLRVVKLEPGCGRMQNRLVTFEDGTKACARYRQNGHLMQGEIYSYAIAKLLKIPNLPPMATSLPDIDEQQWARVGGAILSANWQSNKLVILTKYLPDTTDVVLPQELKPMTENSLSPEEITPTNADILAQWSDMIVFDYIVGNMDRLVNTLHNKQWNSNIMDMPVHNLAQKGSSLIFFDNEDGLFHGYRILDRYSQYHQQSLRAICVFRHSTKDAITRLFQAPDLMDTLVSQVKNMDDRILKYLPKISTKTTNLLRERLRDVEKHIKECEKRYL